MNSVGSVSAVSNNLCLRCDQPMTGTGDMHFECATEVAIAWGIERRKNPPKVKQTKRKGQHA